MAQDKTMPPTEAPTPKPDAMPGEMAAQTPEDTATGQVMVQMPSDAFDSIYTLVTQLATGLESLKADVESQKGGAVATAEEEVAPEAVANAEDEEFLKSLAAEGSMR